jgi:ubiquinone/menaquinone biosynthesis C-methylase UbiE
MVGPDGAVTGIDRNAAYLAQGRVFAAEPGAAPIHYLEADLTGDLGALADQRFDAIVIRRVLMYLPDPEGLIARLPALLKPGGLLAVQEHDATGLPISASACLASSAEPSVGVTSKPCDSM